MKVRVVYPVTDGELVLRTDADWSANLAPTRVEGDGSSFEFHLPDGATFRYYKPMLLRDGRELWSQGMNALALSLDDDDVVYPHFEPDDSCHVCTKYAAPSAFEERGYEFRVFLPPGYGENTLQRFPVLYMQDGQNLFFQQESAFGKHWRVQETLDVLGSMNLLCKVIVVGVYPRDRMANYTNPGYEEYGRFLVEELKPWIDTRYRTLAGPEHTAVMGSSLGGVVSFFLGWNWPEVFGMVGCMSSTFGYRDDLVQRVAAEAVRPVRVYLDSGWPHDNYEATRCMHAALVSRGWDEGRDLQYVAFPGSRHQEGDWAARVHVPFQFFFRA